jgi:hypothetical protein
MKNAIKFGFGFALGTCLFKACKTVADDFMSKKFKQDAEFRLHVKEVSPTLYARYRKDNAAE